MNILDRLANSKFRSRFKLLAKELEYIKDKGMDKSKATLKILFGIGLLRQNLLMMANKLRCEDILFLSLNTQPLLAAAAVLKNGTNSPNIEN